MPVLEQTPLGVPLPHPDNDPRGVDVPRLRDALLLIDQLLSGLAGNVSELATAIETVTSVDLEELEELEEKIVLANQRIATILADGVDAGLIAESAERVFVTPTQRSTIGATAETLADFGQTLATEIEARATAIASLRAELRRHSPTYTLAFGG